MILNTSPAAIRALAKLFMKSMASVRPKTHLNVVARTNRISPTVYVA